MFLIFEFKFKAARNNKSSHEFVNAQIVQTLNSNNNFNQTSNNSTNLNNSQIPFVANSNVNFCFIKIFKCKRKDLRELNLKI